MANKIPSLYANPDRVGPRGLFGGLSLNSQFKVSLHLGKANNNSGNEDTDTLKGHLSKCGVFDTWKASMDSYDFFASDAELPGVNFDVTEQPGGFQGMLEYNATRRIYPDFNVTFYVDTKYYLIRMFEEWLNYINPLYGSQGKYIGGGSGMRGFGEEEPGAYYRMAYPRGYTGYKHNISITKFERDFLKDPNESKSRLNDNRKQTLMAYEIVDAFPKQVTAMPVNYEGSQLLQCNVVFGYTRYITIHAPNGELSDSKNYAPRAFRKPKLPKPSDFPSTQQLVDRDNRNYGNTVPTGSFGITNSATNAKRQVEAQIHKDTALYGDTFPPGSFGISKKVRREIGVDNARGGSRNRNKRRGSASRARTKTRAMKDMSAAEQQSINDSVDIF